MDENIANIIIAILTITIPSIFTIFTGKKTQKQAETNLEKIQIQANKHSSRQSILQLILEDKLAVMEGKLPENKKAIFEEYEEYHKCYGNHYIDEKIEEYEKWYETITPDTRKVNKKGE